MKKWLLAFLLLYGISSHAVTPEQAMQRLMEGNGRYMRDALEHPNRDQERREAIVAKQKPFATIVGCADSRVSPEIIFDQGVGDLFVVRVAGNVIGDLELDSVDYSVLYLNSSVVIVIGHENCGAVDAVIHQNTKDIEAVAKLIEPSVQQAKKTKTDNLLESAIKANAVRMRDFLLKSRVIAQLVKDKKIEVHAGYYNLRTGAVEILK